MLAAAVIVPLAVKTTLLVLGAKCEFASAHPPATFHVLVDPSTVTEELVIVTAPLVNGATFCVAVPAPLEASNTTASVACGVHPQEEPPEEADQCVVLLKLPLPPTQ